MCDRSWRLHCEPKSSTLPRSRTSWDYPTVACPPFEALEQQRAGSQIAGVLVDERDLGPPQAVRAVGGGLEIDEFYPAIHEASVRVAAR